MNPWTVLKVTASCGVIAIGVTFYFWKKKHRPPLKCTKTKTCQNVFHHVLFFPDKGFVCKHYAWNPKGCDFQSCGFLHTETSFKRLGDFLHNAKKTLDVCVYTISSSVLCDILLEMKKRGIRVRIITDDESENYTGSMIGRFRENGVPLRTDNSSYLMHHKFVIVDGNILINGSFNWTRHAITANNENVIISNNEELVKPFAEEFETLWSKFDPAARQNKKR